MRKVIALALALLAARTLTAMSLTAMSLTAFAQSYPSHEHHHDRALPGRRADRHHRAASLAERMQGALGQSVIIENVSGAGGASASAASRMPRPTVTR